MNKKFSTALVTLGMYFSAAVNVYADTPLLTPPVGSISTNVAAQSIPQLVITILFFVATFLATAYLMYGGIKWITSGGDKAGVESAKKHIMSAIIGIVVVAGTFFMLNILFNVLGAENPLSKNFTLPTLKDSTSP